MPVWWSNSTKHPGRPRDEGTRQTSDNKGRRMQRIRFATWRAAALWLAVAGIALTFLH